MAAGSDVDLVYGLVTIGDLEALKKFTPCNFDLNQRMGCDQLPALMTLISRPEYLSHSNFLNMAEWMLQRGADPQRRLPAMDSKQKQINWFKVGDKASTQISVLTAGHSALTFVFAFVRLMQEGKGGADWSDTIALLKKFIALTARSAPATGERIPVHPSVVEFWESARDMTSTHNVIFEAADGEVSAHDHILRSASPVLKAMLDSTMKEGSSRRIAVKDSSATGVSLFLDIVYTSSTYHDIDHPTMLAALDLAHRWQVMGIVDLISGALPNMLSNQSFAAIAEAAVLKGLEPLQRACSTFAANNTVIKAEVKKGTLPAAVQKLVGAPASDEGATGAKKKKRRTF